MSWCPPTHSPGLCWSWSPPDSSLAGSAHFAQSCWCVLPGRAVAKGRWLRRLGGAPAVTLSVPGPCGPGRPRGMRQGCCQLQCPVCPACPLAVVSCPGPDWEAWGRGPPAPAGTTGSWVDEAGRVQGDSRAGPLPSLGSMGPLPHFMVPAAKTVEGSKLKRGPGGPGTHPVLAEPQPSGVLQMFQHEGGQSNCW